MSEEDFLKRWSRRKRAVAADARSEQPDAAAREAVPNDTAAEKKKSEPQAEFDPASLPSLESITSVSDVTAFLRAGVPAELTRAALRRVWTVDPAIRDFVGLAENAWDFTDPNAMPGFGPLEATEEVRRMVASIVDNIGERAKTVAESAHEASQAPQDVNDSSQIASADHDRAVPRSDSSAEPPEQSEPQEPNRQVLLQSKITDDAVQNNVGEVVDKPRQIVRRSHGGALPE